MLVLSRHENQKIMIGDDIVITIVEIDRNKVRLGFSCPDEIQVHREEVYQAIQKGVPFVRKGTT